MTLILDFRVEFWNSIIARVRQIGWDVVVGGEWLGAINIDHMGCESVIHDYDRDLAWPSWETRIYRTVTGVTSDAGMLSTSLVTLWLNWISTLHKSATCKLERCAGSNNVSVTKVKCPVPEGILHRVKSQSVRWKNIIEVSLIRYVGRRHVFCYCVLCEPPAISECTSSFAIKLSENNVCARVRNCFNAHGRVI